MRERITVTGAFDVPNQRLNFRRPTCPGSLELVGSSTSYSGVMSTKLIRDVETPGFQALKKCGRFLPLNPVTISTTTHERIPLTGYAPEWRTRSGPCAGQPVTRDTGPVVDTTAFRCVLPPVQPSVPQAVVNSAVSDARTAAWDVLTFLAEWTSTYRLLAKTIKSVASIGRRAASDARSMRTKRPLSERFSQKWLEYRYGWMPLIYDMEDAVKALSMAENKMARGRATYSETGSVTEVWTASSTATRSDWSEVLTFERVHRGWAAAEFDIMSSRFGLDPIRTAWELVPFSFVMDWFVQVGDFIEATSPFGAGRTLGSCYSCKTTMRRELYRRMQALDSSASTGHGDSGSQLVQVETLTEYVRVPMGASLPGWNPRLTWQRTVDAAALSRGLTRDVFRRLRI